MNKQDIIAAVIPVLRQYPVTRASFFGSYARGDFTQNSDIDILVEFGVESVGLMFYSLREDLVNVLKTELDLIHKPGLIRMEQEFQNNVRAEEEVFYEKNSTANP